MKRFITLFSLGLGLALGGGLIYAFYTSEAMRLVVVGLGGFLLAAVTIGGTALLVNRQWTGAVSAGRNTHHHRYQVTSPVAQALPGREPVDLLPPLELHRSASYEADEIVA